MAVLFPTDLDTVHPPLMASDEAGRTGLSIGGNRQFAVRVESDLSVLRVSPNGQKLLHALDMAAQRSGQPVSIEPGDENNARFTPSTDADTLMIRDGQPGTPAYGGLIEYNPFFSPPGSLPIIGLYHELCHAYNAVTGTVAPGTTDETDGGKTVAIKNVERQAVGLPIDLAPFDFDLNPDTPPTRTNPEAFTENFSPLAKGYLLAEDVAKTRWVIEEEGARIIFPNPKVKNGLRAGILIVPTSDAALV